MLRDGQFTIIKSPKRELPGSQFVSPDQLNSPDFAFNEYFKSQAIAELKNEATGREFALAPKTGTYGDRDLMLIAIDDDRAVNFEHLSHEDGFYYFTVLKQIRDVLMDDKDVRHIVIGTNINPEETELKTAQSIKTLHTHIVGYKEGIFDDQVGKPLDETIDELVKQKLNVGGKEITDEQEKRIYYQRQLDDPFIPLSQDILLNRIEKITDDLHINVDVSTYSQGIVIDFKSDMFANPLQMFELQNEVEKQIHLLYHQLEKVFADRGDGRPEPRSYDEIAPAVENFIAQQNLSEQSGKRLRALSRSIKPALEGNRDQWFLKGFAFTITAIMDKQTGSNRLFISPKVISGMGILESVGAVLLRDTDVKFSEQEIADQNNFYHKSVDKLTTSIPGAKSGQYLEQI